MHKLHRSVCGNSPPDDSTMAVVAAKGDCSNKQNYVIYYDFYCAKSPPLDLIMKAIINVSLDKYV